MNQTTFTILIVDDEKHNRDLLEALLRTENYVTRTAASGEEALAEVERELPDLILLDIMMPGIDGFEVARRLKANPRSKPIPIIIVTMLEDRESKLRGLEAGAEDFLSKPVDRAELWARVRNLLRLKEYNDFLDDHNRILELEVRERTAELLAEEQKLKRANRALRTLSACNVALVHAGAEEELFQTVCRHIVEAGEHLFAGVFFAGAEPEGFPYPVSSFGDGAIRKRLAELQDDPEYVRRRLTHAALQARQTMVYNGKDNGAEYGLEKLAGLGIGSALALPLLNNAHVYGALTVFSPSPEAFDAAEIKLLEELAGDIAYGIATLRTRAERDRSAAKLRQTLEQTITAIAMTLEKRDAYSAGHQQRVAKLAAAIAAEMGLAQPQVEGVRFGALLHNIGTVGVPAEILNRPDKLSDLQFALIKQHTQTGYEIVKDIPFPWPVAQMVLQHHERLDGSGYPHGLKGEQVILEARILAVADVLEAMTAYRPYRAALEKDAALAALTQGRGTQFDAAVVDACLRVMQK